MMKMQSSFLEGVEKCLFSESSTEKFNKNHHHHHDTSFKNLKFAFQAHYSDIKNIEVEPGVIQILSNEDKKEKENSNKFVSDNKFNKVKIAEQIIDLVFSLKADLIVISK